MHPTRKAPELPVVERDTAVGPVDRLMHLGVAVAKAVNSNLATQRRILRRRTMLSQGHDDGVIFFGGDLSLDIRAPRDARGGIIEAVERAETAVAINPGHMECAARRGFITPEMYFGDTAAADGNVAETSQDVVFRGENRQGKCLGIHQDPGLPVNRPGCSG